MFAKLFALFFGKKKDPEPTMTFAQRMGQQDAQRRGHDMYGGGSPFRASKARPSRSATSSTRRDDDIMSNPIHPLNPFNPIGLNSQSFYDSTPSHTSHSSSSYDCGSSSSSSYDSGSSSSSCDSGSSSSSSD